MEEEEEAHTAVEKVMAIAAYEVEAKDTTTLARAALLREDYATLSVPTCSATIRRPQQIK